MDAKSWRELNAIVARLEKPLTRAAEMQARSAVANEQLLALANKEQMSFEVEPSPPICPVCGQMNPIVFMSERSGSGPMNEIVLELETSCCHRRIYAIPEGWAMTPVRDEAIDIVRERAGVKNVADAGTNPNGS
jgi:hypothetical protein